MYTFPYREALQYILVIDTKCTAVGYIFSLCCDALQYIPVIDANCSTVVHTLLHCDVLQYILLIDTKCTIYGTEEILFNLLDMHMA